MASGGNGAAVGATNDGGQVKHFPGLYLTPRDAFERILPRRGVIVAFLLMLVVTLTFSAIWASRVDAHEFIRAQIQESPRADKIPAEQLDNIIEMQVKVFRVMVWVGPIVFGPLMVLLIAGLYQFVFGFVLGAELRYKDSVSVVAWSFVAVQLVSVPLTMAVLFAKGSWNIDPSKALDASPAVLLDAATSPKPLRTLLASFDLVNLWILGLLSTGYSVATRRPFGLAVGGVVGLWAIWVIGKVGLAFVF